MVLSRPGKSKPFLRSKVPTFLHLYTLATASYLEDDHLPARFLYWSIPCSQRGIAKVGNFEPTSDVTRIIPCYMYPWQAHGKPEQTSLQFAGDRDDLRMRRVSQRCGKGVTVDSQWQVRYSNSSESYRKPARQYCCHLYVSTKFENLGHVLEVTKAPDSK